MIRGYLTLVLYGAALLFGKQLQAQCWDFKEGDTYVVKSETWMNTLVFEPKWAKWSPEVREEKIAEHNEAIYKGKKPDQGGDITISVKSITNYGDLSSMHVQSIKPHTNYQTTVFCSEDTVFLVRFPEPIFMVDKGDTLGMMIMAVEKIPAKLKVGDLIPPYTDMTIMFSNSWTAEVTEKVKRFSYYSTQRESFGYGTDANGNYGWGPVDKTVRHDVYETINHLVTISQQIKNVTINNAFAMVTGTEEFKWRGQTLTAYIIESENWSKQEVIRDYDAEKNSYANQVKQTLEKMDSKIAKKFAKIFPVNELGYSVVYRKEWYVPGIGIVKTESHDANGALFMRSSISMK